MRVDGELEEFIKEVEDGMERKHIILISDEKVFRRSDENG